MTVTILSPSSLVPLALLVRLWGACAPAAVLPDNRPIPPQLFAYGSLVIPAVVVFKLQDKVFGAKKFCTRLLFFPVTDD
jgi:hypothetical protein